MAQEHNTYYQNETVAGAMHILKAAKAAAGESLIISYSAAGPEINSQGLS